MGLKKTCIHVHKHIYLCILIDVFIINKICKYLF